MESAEGPLVSAGSLVWWCRVVSLVGAARHVVGPGARLWIDRVSGAVLALFGVAEVRRAV